ncbi:MAG: DinB family protein [Gemmatimonadota bacterium]
MTIFTNPADAAPEAAAAYIEAVLGTLGARDPIEVLGGTPGELERLVRDVPPALLRRPESPGRWSVGEVLAHLADSELVWAFRLRMVLGQERPSLAGYDQDAWAEGLSYADLDPSSSLERFDFVRRWNLALLGSVPEQALDRVGVHAERGEESVRHMIRLYAGHDLVHLAQLRRILAAHRDEDES